MSRKVVIEKRSRIFDNFFEIDEFYVAHEKSDGSMSAGQRELVFERGDAVAVLLLNLDCKSVVLVKQFRMPVLEGRTRDVESSMDGWITEIPTGMIDANERPEAAIVRETMEETGYVIRNPKLIARFFSSPGGTSERIFLYFSEVREPDRSGKGGGIGTEDIEIIQKPIDELFAELRRGSIEDSKLLVGAYWLSDYLKSIGNLDPSVAAAKKQHSQTDAGREPLAFGTVKYALKDHRHLIVGYKTGEIQSIKDVCLWVNSENQDMLMDRFLGKTVSANIRYLGSIKDRDGNVTEDRIEEALRSAVGQRPRVEIGTVLDTKSGALRTTHGVMRIFHVATVKGVGFGKGVKAELSDLPSCVDQVLARAEERNQRLWRRFWKMRKLESVLIPMLGAGDGGLSPEEVAAALIPRAIRHFQNNLSTNLGEIYFLAYTARDKSAYDEALEEWRAKGILVRLEH